MKTTIFIVTYKKDFVWLKYCLKGIAKFATGFEVAILVPDQDRDELEELFIELGSFPLPARIMSGQEWPDKGFLWHACQIMRADEWCPDSDFVAHFDPDCIFTEPVTPETFIKDGKPVLQYESFDTLGKRCPGVLNWKRAAEDALPFEVNFETMRGHPETYPRWLYSRVRELVCSKTQMQFDNYIMSGKNDYPQDRAEFPTIGAVALKMFSEHFTLVDNSEKKNPDRSDFPVVQFWSHNSPEKPQDIWVFGEQKRIFPLQLLKSYGLT